MVNDPGQITTEGIDTGVFPFDAFTATKPSAVPPVVGMTGGWKLLTDTVIGSATLADDDEVVLYDASESAYRKITLLSLASAFGTILGV